MRTAAIALVLVAMSGCCLCERIRCRRACRNCQCCDTCSNCQDSCPTYSADYQPAITSPAVPDAPQPRKYEMVPIPPVQPSNSSVLEEDEGPPPPPGN